MVGIDRKRVEVELTKLELFFLLFLQQEMVAKGMGKTKALTDGPIPVSYIEVIAAIRDFSENSMDSDRAATTAAELQTLVATQFPEYATKIVDWRTIASLVNRVPVDAWTLIEDFALKHQMMSPPIPQTWLRDPSLGCVEAP